MLMMKMKNNIPNATGSFFGIRIMAYMPLPVRKIKANKETGWVSPTKGTWLKL
jgi:hypothetical protein